MPAHPFQAVFHCQAAADRPLQTPTPPIDQVVPDMRATMVLARLRGSCLCENNSFACHCHLATRADPGHVLDDMPVAVAGREILARVCT